MSIYPHHTTTYIIESRDLVLGESVDRGRGDLVASHHKVVVATRARTSVRLAPVHLRVNVHGVKLTGDVARADVHEDASDEDKHRGSNVDRDQ